MTLFGSAESTDLEYLDKFTSSYFAGVLGGLKVRVCFVW